MIDVTIKVDERRLAEFYAMYAKWMNAASRAEMDRGGSLSDWGSGDIDEASHVWSKMSPGARKLFEILLRASGPVPWGELAQALGPDAREDTIFGTFGSPAKLAKAVGRKHMVKSGQTPHGNSYWLEPTVKVLFEQVRA